MESRSGVSLLPAPPAVGLGRLRKIALVGNAGSSLVYAPWHDATWEIWSHTSTKTLVKRVDRYFDLHPKAFWLKGKSWDPEYVKWLARNPVPILMQNRFTDVPASVRYPRERVMAEFPRRYFTSQTAWMIALALTEGVTHLGFFGVHYAHSSEYATQRAGCEYWMGIAEGRGVHLVIPETNPLLKTPGPLYGYESHSEGTLHAAYRVTMPKQDDGPAGPVGGELIDLANPEAPRPPLRDLGEPVAWERSGHPAPVLRDGVLKEY